MANTNGGGFQLPEYLQKKVDALFGDETRRTSKLTVISNSLGVCALRRRPADNRGFVAVESNSTSLRLDHVWLPNGDNRYVSTCVTTIVNQEGITHHSTQGPQTAPLKFNPEEKMQRRLEYGLADLANQPAFKDVFATADARERADLQQHARLFGPVVAAALLEFELPALPSLSRN